MLRNADRAYTRTTTAVRHCEGLVQIEVANVGTDIAGVSQTNLCVHISTIHIYLTTSVVNSIYNLADATLEYAVSRGVGYHQTAQLR